MFTPPTEAQLVTQDSEHYKFHWDLPEKRVPRMPNMGTVLVYGHIKMTNVSENTVCILGL
jgi:hypothetical protein